jgi:CheY-like chemotaxis protein
MSEPAQPREEAALILVVDDDPEVLTALSETLEAEGYSVRGARDGIEALEVIRECRPDLIITDLLMPTMTGFELLGALHDDPELATIPTLIITAARGPETQEPAGAKAIFPKPLDLDRLLRAINVYTHGSDRRRTSN